MQLYQSKQNILNKNLLFSHVYLFYSSECIVNTSQIPPITDDDAWACAVDNNAFPDKPIINKKFTKKPVSTKLTTIKK